MCVWVWSRNLTQEAFGATAVFYLQLNRGSFESKHNYLTLSLFKLTTCFGLCTGPSSGHKIYNWGDYTVWIVNKIVWCIKQDIRDIHADSNRCHSERDCHRSTKKTQLWNADISISHQPILWLFVRYCHGQAHGGEFRPRMYLKFKDISSSFNLYFTHSRSKPTGRGWGGGSSRAMRHKNVSKHRNYP